MQRLPPGSKVILDDRLVKCWRLLDGSVRCQGKRVQANCPLPEGARRAYAEAGNSTAPVKWLMDNQGMSLAAAWELVKAAR